MKDTLTLELDSDVAALVERHAEAAGKSLSEWVESVIRQQVTESTDASGEWKEMLHPSVRALIGSADGAGWDGEDAQEAYFRHAARKHA